MKIKLTQAVACLAAFAAMGSTLNAVAGTLHHDQVKGFSENLTAVEIKFKPQLKVFNGCVPFPAVDAAGNTSEGLDPSGAVDGKCSSSPGQVYARGGIYNDECGVMYSWYFPKDQPAAGARNGHRHDWEFIVVWLPHSACDGNTNVGINAVAYSKHGGTSTKVGSSVPLSGTHPKVGYQGFPDDHHLFDTASGGGTQPGIDWYRLTQAAGRALSTTDFGAANVPFIDKNFGANLAKAWYK